VKVTVIFCVSEVVPVIIGDGGESRRYAPNQLLRFVIASLAFVDDVMLVDGNVEKSGVLRRGNTSD
jgi:hypothetical protein